MYEVRIKPWAVTPFYQPAAPRVDKITLILPWRDRALILSELSHAGCTQSWHLPDLQLLEEGRPWV